MFTAKTLVRALALSAFGLALATGAQAATGQLKDHHKALTDCAACHTPENAVGGNALVVPDNKGCLACHGSWKDLAEKTKPADPHEPNPHASHHYGENMACTACHAEHKESRVLCNDCHAFPFKPMK